MPEVLKPDNRSPKAPQERGKYDWEEWLRPGGHLLFHRYAGPWGEGDFPGTEAMYFRQTAYNAASRLGVSITGKIRDDGNTVEIWVHGRTPPVVYEGDTVTFVPKSGRKRKMLVGGRERNFVMLADVKEEI